jgi:aspartate/methionine/tyrosine aminotransferase
MDKVRQHYQDLRDVFFETIDLFPDPPEAGYFMFFSIESFLSHKTYDQIIDECLEQGVSVAPGEDFGRGFENYIRVCFTGEPAERLERGAATLRRILID